MKPDPPVIYRRNLQPIPLDKRRKLFIVEKNALFTSEILFPPLFQQVTKSQKKKVRKLQGFEC
jgi:hypothetical protein